MLVSDSQFLSGYRVSGSPGSNMVTDDLVLEAVMAKARSLAGPEDAKTMVGVDFGGLRIVP